MKNGAERRTWDVRSRAAGAASRTLSGSWV